jgi:hypothetical protein
LIALLGGGDMQQGVWGIFRVSKEVAVTHQAESDANGRGFIAGYVMAKSGEKTSASVTVLKDNVKLAEAPINASDGSFQLTLNGVAAGDLIRIETSNGATYTTKLRAGNALKPAPSVILESQK